MFTDGARKCAKKLIELAGFPRHHDTMGALSASRHPGKGCFIVGGLETVVGVAWPLEMENGQGIFMGQGMKSGGVLRIIHLVVGRAS